MVETYMVNNQVDFSTDAEQEDNPDIAEVYKFCNSYIRMITQFLFVFLSYMFV